MADRIASVLDHVAVAVPDLEKATSRWVGQLGAGQVTRGGNRIFRSQQFRYANGARLELLTTGREATPDSFVPKFLERFGAGIHHLTLKVEDLHQALDVLTAGGLEPVDVHDEYEPWQEAFLRPSQVGGLVVQVAASPLDEATWAEMTKFQPQQPRQDAAVLLGPLLRHPDMDLAASLWTLLGATVEVTDAGLRCTWPDSPLDVVVAEGSPAGPVALRMRGTDPLPSDPDFGPAVHVV